MPKPFKLAPRTWKVVRAELPLNEQGLQIHGLTEFDSATIIIAPDVEHPEQVFLHELLHATSDAMGWERVNRDEPRIDALAGLLTQALTTAK